MWKNILRYRENFPEMKAKISSNETKHPNETFDYCLIQQIINQIGKKTPNGVGQDLISNGIQRARDQGVCSYTCVRQALGLMHNITSFQDLKTYKLMSDEIVDLLPSVFYDFFDVDSSVGGALELMSNLGNGLLGTTFGDVIGKQWDNFADGDPSSPHPLSKEQIWGVRNYTMSNVICGLHQNQHDLLIYSKTYSYY